MTLTAGDKVIFSAFDGIDYFATVTRINRGVATLKYYVKGTGAVSYLAKADWNRLKHENHGQAPEFLLQGKIDRLKAERALLKNQRRIECQ